MTFFNIFWKNLFGKKERFHSTGYRAQDLSIACRISTFSRSNSNWKALDSIPSGVEAFLYLQNNFSEYSSLIILNQNLFHFISSRKLCTIPKKLILGIPKLVFSCLKICAIIVHQDIAIQNQLYGSNFYILGRKIIFPSWLKFFSSFEKNDHFWRECFNSIWKFSPKFEKNNGVYGIHLKNQPQFFLLELLKFRYFPCRNLNRFLSGPGRAPDNQPG